MDLDSWALCLHVALSYVLCYCPRACKQRLGNPVPTVASPCRILLLGIHLPCSKRFALGMWVRMEREGVQPDSGPLSKTFLPIPAPELIAVKEQPLLQSYGDLSFNPRHLRWFVMKPQTNQSLSLLQHSRLLSAIPKQHTRKKRPRQNTQGLQKNFSATCRKYKP